jgi:non-specific serine/threonine protein kinase
VSILVHDIGRARDIVQQGLESAREVGDKPGTSFALLMAASLAGGRGGPARAARLWGAAEALREAIGISLGDQDPFDYDYEGRVAAARAQLEEAAWEAAWNEGRAMSPEQAIEYALSEEEKPPTKESPRPEQSPTDVGQRPAALTRRELEVAMLITREMTNRRIAEELVISERTVATHVHKILEKLNLRSRVQIAAWAIEQDLLR